MKYHYKKPEILVQTYGRPITLEHAIYKGGTLYFEQGKGIIVTQKQFNANTKECYWGCVDIGLANDIYISKNFRKYFFEHALEKDYPIVEVRKLMWQLRMKPLPKEDWELYF